MEMQISAINIPAPTGTLPAGLIVILHGWGANAQDLAPLSTELNLPEFQFILPDAFLPHPQVPGGRMWYDLASPQYDGLGDSRGLLADWLLSLEGHTQVPLSRTILCGFSQGGAMALDIGSQLPLAGLVILSGYLHVVPEKPEAQEIPPILMIHGRQDQVVPVQAAQQARETFEALGAQINYYELDMGHEIRPEAVQLMQSFIIKTFSPVE